jgi:DNA excision repair protein ERCC-1
MASNGQASGVIDGQHHHHQQQQQQQQQPQQRGASVQQPKPQALAAKGSTASILVSTRQKGNPILQHVRGLPWEYADIPADYVLGTTTCALFLSLKYHRLHPEYIYRRIRDLQGKYALRIVLVMVDIEAHEEPLKELSKTSLINNVTIVLAWSAPEAGRYLELFKTYEHAPPTSIKAHQSQAFPDRLIAFTNSVRSVNKTDAIGLVSNFGTVRTAINARPEEVALIAGWGEKKVQRWSSAVREPFRAQKAARKGLVIDLQFKDGLDRPASDETGSTALAQELRPKPAAQPSSNTRTTQPSSAATQQSRKRPAEPEVDEGVAAALAKLRAGQ